MASSKGSNYLKIITGSVKTKTYGFVAFTLLVVIILLVGAIRPTLLTITRINKEIKDKRFVNEQLEVKLDNLAKLGVQYNDIEEDARDLTLLFPSEGNFSLFMANVEEISKSYGYNLNSINFGEPDGVESEFKALAPFSSKISVTGKKTNLIKLLGAYEAMPMFPVVRQVSYASTTNDEGLTNFSIELIVYQVENTGFFE